MNDSIETIHRSCPTCEATCGLVLEVDKRNKRVISVKGDPNDPRSKGYVCAKSPAFQYIYEDPERLRRPVKRVGNKWQEISWDEALDYTASKLIEIRNKHGKDNIALYVGNPTGHEFGVQLYMQLALSMINTERFFSAGSVDQNPKNLSSQIAYGDPWFIAIPDIDNTEFFLCMGANPVVSQGSLFSAPNAKKRIQDLKERGGRMVVIDPRRTETAEMADQHIFVKPGGDAFLLFSMVREIFTQGWVKQNHVLELSDGIDKIEALAAPFTPEVTAPFTGVDPEVLRQLTREFCQASRATCYGRLGLCTQRYGTIASWLCDVIGILTGNLDSPGGMMFPRQATGQTEFTGDPVEFPHDRWRSKVSDYPEFFGQLPASFMAEEITAPGENKVRAMLTLAGNPVLTVPNGARIREAFSTVDFMACIDIYINETTSMADIILPPTVQLEHSNYDFLFAGTSVRNFARYTPQVFEPEEGTMPQWQIVTELVARMNDMTMEQADDLVFEGIIDLGHKINDKLDFSKEEIREKLGDKRGPERLLDCMLRTGPYGDKFHDDSEGLSLKKLKEIPHALDLGPLQPRIPEFLRTDNKRVQLMHPILEKDIQRLTKELAEGAKSNGMLLIGRRHIRDMNSWLHNIEQYTRGDNRCTLRINPEDAKRIGVADGNEARLRSRVNEVIVPVEVSDELMPGVVSLPHGFGHIYQDSQQSTAQKTPGASCNFVIDDQVLDLPSGTSVVNGAAVEVLPL